MPVEDFQCCIESGIVDRAFIALVWRGDMIDAIPCYITRLSVIIASLVQGES